MQGVVTSIVIYAKDITRVANFYQRTLSVSKIDEEPSFIVVGNDNLEIAIVRIRESIAKEIQISMPPRVREETPIKCSFLVEDLDKVRAEATDAGGGTKPVTSAWLWRGELHLDGHDPEGNVVQFRKRKD
ncbi:MAG TPA: hypothetical protein VFC63_24580 [Blastocatellia bacterium]|nr:hypothetical protein [Blastocatellia bacterium]